VPHGWIICGRGMPEYPIYPLGSVALHRYALATMLARGHRIRA